jgi:hypothetical protein
MGRSGLNVLLAAQHDGFAEAFGSMLEERGCKVTVMSTAEEALEQLPVRRSDGERAVVLVVGGGEHSHVVQRIFDLGASAYIVDPPSADNFSSADLQRFVDLVVRPQGEIGLLASDVCPFSAGGEYHRCNAYVPISISASGGENARVTSCTNLRVGTSSAIVAYPRCAIGTQAARDKYARDQTS